MRVTSSAMLVVCPWHLPLEVYVANALMQDYTINSMAHIVLLR